MSSNSLSSSNSRSLSNFNSLINEKYPTPKQSPIKEKDLTKLSTSQRVGKFYASNRKAIIGVGTGLAAGIVVALLAAFVPHSAWQSMEHTLNQYVWTRLGGVIGGSALGLSPFLLGGLAFSLIYYYKTKKAEKPEQNNQAEKKNETTQINTKETEGELSDSDN